MTDIRRVGGSGVHTVEGNVAGSRAAMLNKQRETQKREYEAVRNKIKEDNAAGVGRIDDKFNSASDRLEHEFRKKTVGLVSADDFRKARESVNEQQLAELQAQQQRQQETQLSKQQQREQKRRKVAASLSFGFGDDEGDDFDAGTSMRELKKQKIETTAAISSSSSSPASATAVSAAVVVDAAVTSTADTQRVGTVESMSDSQSLQQQQKRSLKNPAVDTSFLPDAQRDAELQSRRAQLEQQWLQEQERAKNELLEVVYSYWDGSGHRKSITLRKGTTVGRFLELCKQQLMADFHTMRSTSAEDLVYVKEDLIIPHHYSFYDLIVTKARGKSGPLFHFDVHDDVRLINDATVEKDESHPGKVAERRWYERNKHIFPASRWEVYDPKVNRDNMKYTIHGDEVVP